MKVIAFHPFVEGIQLEDNQIGHIKCTEVTYKESLYDVGTFSLGTSANEAFTNKLNIGNIIFIKDKNITLWGVIRGIDNQSGFFSPISRYGEDLSSYIAQRVVVPTDLNGYDSIKGSTETVIKHYIVKNLVSPTDKARKIQCFTVAEDKHRGKADDKYMARFNNVREIIKEVGTAEKIGYKVDVDLKNSNMVFDVIKEIDRTAWQSDRPRVIFDVDLGTAENSKLTEDITNYRNLFYTSKTGTDLAQDETTLELWREKEAEPTGANRFESHINVSVDNDAEDIVGEMKNLAAKQMTDYERELNFTLKLNSNLVYGKDFFLGDFVTIQDRRQGISEDVQLIEVTHTWKGANSYTIEGTFGKPLKTRFDMLQREMKRGGMK